MDPLGAERGEQQARGEQDQPLVGVREAAEQLAPQRVACGSWVRVRVRVRVRVTIRIRVKGYRVKD